LRRAANNRQLTIVIVLLGLVSAAYGSPLLEAFLGAGQKLAPAINLEDGWGRPFLRSGVFACLSTLIFLPSSLFFALLVKDCSKYLRGFLALLMMPMLMGGVALAFIIKLDTMRMNLVTTAIANRAFAPTWGLMLLAQGWQVVPLFLYLFWFRLQLVPERVLRFARASQLTPWEYARDIYWPHTRNLAGILALLGAALSFYEFIKFHLVLRASPGGGTELASHWLLRWYSSYATVDPNYATQVTLAMSAVGVLIAVVVALLAVLVTVAGLDWCLRRHPRALLPWRVRDPRIADAVALVAILATMAPLLGLARYFRWGVFIDLGEFFRSVTLSVAAASVTLLLSIVLGVCVRILLRRTMEKFDSRSAPLFGLLYFLQMVPPIGVALCGYHWLAKLGGTTTWVPLLWLVSQVIVSLPLTASFVQVSHFRVSTRELEFQESSRVGFSDLMWHSFLRRFGLDYGLVAIFGFSIIWTEATVNSTLSSLSRSIPSVAVELSQRVDGRGASYQQAANLILVTLVPVILALALWTFDLRRRKVFSDKSRNGLLGRRMEG